MDNSGSDAPNDSSGRTSPSGGTSSDDTIVTRQEIITTIPIAAAEVKPPPKKTAGRKKKVDNGEGAVAAPVVEKQKRSKEVKPRKKYEKRVKEVVAMDATGEGGSLNSTGGGDVVKPEKKKVGRKRKTVEPDGEGGAAGGSGIGVSANKKIRKRKVKKNFWDDADAMVLDAKEINPEHALINKTNGANDSVIKTILTSKNESTLDYKFNSVLDSIVAQNDDEKVVKYLLNSGPLMELYQLGTASDVAVSAKKKSSSEILSTMDESDSEEKSAAQKMMNTLRPFNSFLKKEDTTNVVNTSELNYQFMRIVGGASAVVRKVPSTKREYGGELTMMDMCTRHNPPVPKKVIEKSGRMTCPVCHRSEKDMNTGIHTFPYGTDIESTSYSYLRTNHLKDWINNIQSINREIASEDDINKIKDILTKDHISLNFVTVKEVRKAIHKNTFDLTSKKKKKMMNSTKFEEGMWQKVKGKKLLDMAMPITFKIRGDKPPRFTPKQIKILNDRWAKLQVVWIDAKSKDDKNFLPYGFAIFKCCEIEQWTQFYPYIKIPSNSEKRYKHDQTWKRMMAKLQQTTRNGHKVWPYIETALMD